MAQAPDSCLRRTVSDLHRLLTIEQVGKSLPIEVVRGTGKQRLNVIPIEKMGR
jgi:hypothetical protein